MPIGDTKQREPIGPAAGADPDADWDRAVGAFADATLFHRAAWWRVLQDTYRYTPCGTTIGAADQPTALLPLLEVRSRLTGVRGVALPFSDTCPPLCADAGALADLLAALRAQGRARGWRTFEIRGGHDWLPAAPIAASFLGHRLPLADDTERLFAQCESAARRAVRHAQRQGVQVRRSTSRADLPAFYRLLCRTRRRHGLPPPPFAFFVHLQRRLLATGQGSLFLATSQRRPVAGALFLHDAAHALYKFGASDERYQHLRANNLVMWEAIQWHAAHGCTVLDFGRTDATNAGLRRFKRAWGAEEFSLAYLRYDLALDRFVPASGLGTPGAVSWSAPLFRHLPLTVNRLCGRLLYRHLG